MQQSVSARVNYDFNHVVVPLVWNLNTDVEMVAWLLN